VPHSMTGFGSADGPVAGGRLQVDVRSVNHRHFNLQLRVPVELQPLESDIRERLRAKVTRGHVTVSGSWMEAAEQPAVVRLNLTRAREVVAALRELKRSLKLRGDVDLGWVIRQPDVLVTQAGDPTTVEPEAVWAVLDRATEGLLAMRAAEGAALARELEAQLDAIAAHLATVVARAPERLHAERDRLRDAVATLLDGAQLDPGRLAQEIALIADRLDVAEEVARLRTHVAAARAALTGDAPAGRQLGFLGQEMLREINTIGSKANDAAITQTVIAMKAELEKFREQVENIE
jgi:uncharacterized protein (TIGR00255 family)